MKNIIFKGVNLTIAKDQDEYNMVFAEHDKEAGTITMCFEFTPEELLEIIQTRRLWIKKLTFNGKLQPFSLATKKEDLV